MMTNSDPKGQTFQSHPHTHDSVMKLGLHAPSQSCHRIPTNITLDIVFHIFRETTSMDLVTNWLMHDFCEGLFICALWSPAGKRLTNLLALLCGVLL